MFFEYGVFGELDEGEDVGTAGALVVDDEVGVHVADGGAADAGAFESAGLDEAAGVVAFGIFKYAAAGVAFGLGFLAAGDVVVVFGLLVFFGRLELEGAAEDESAGGAEGLAAVAVEGGFHRDGLGASIGGDVDGFHEFADGAVDGSGVHEDG